MLIKSLKSMLSSHYYNVICTNSIKLCPMKKLISPKDFLFLTMLFLIISVGFLGFRQSARIKNQINQQASEIVKKPKIGLFIE